MCVYVFACVCVCVCVRVHLDIVASICVGVALDLAQDSLAETGLPMGSRVGWRLRDG